MKIRSDDIEAIYKRTKKVYVMVLDHVIDRRVRSRERCKELCKLVEKLGYAIQHFNKFRGL